MLKEILYSILYAVITMCGVAIVKYFIGLIKVAISTINNQNVRDIISDAENIISRVVIETTQTYVDSLKKEGKFDADAQRIAYETTYEKCVSLLGDEAQKAIDTIYGDLGNYLQTMIESAVHSNKEG